jgi:hypothetical protein
MFPGDSLNSTNSSTALCSVLRSCVSKTLSLTLSGISFSEVPQDWKRYCYAFRWWMLLQTEPTSPYQWSTGTGGCVVQWRGSHRSGGPGYSSGLPLALVNLSNTFPLYAAPSSLQNKDVRSSQWASGCEHVLKKLTIQQIWRVFSHRDSEKLKNFPEYTNAWQNPIQTCV